MIHGGAFSRSAWGQIRSAEAVLPAGRVLPTHNPGDKSHDTLSESEWTESMKSVAGLSKRLAKALMGIDLTVRIVRSNEGFLACYGGRAISFNMQRLGRAWFEKIDTDLADVLDLITHEFAHEYESNHLDDHFADACTKLAGKMAVLALEKPGIFR